MDIKCRLFLLVSKLLIALRFEIKNKLLTKRKKKKRRRHRIRCHETGTNKEY